MNDTPRFGILDGLAVVARHKVVVILATVGMVALITLPRVLRPRTYAATASFIPQSSQSNGSSLAGFAAQFGVSLDSRQAGHSPEFYADYVTTRPVLRKAVETEYKLPSSPGTRRVDLVKFYEIDSGSDQVRLQSAIDKLRGELSVGVARQTGVVRMDLRMTDPQMAQQVAARLIELVNEFNVTARMSQAAAERQFVEDRLKEIANDLRVAENRLQAFLQRNRQFAQSPQLAFEHDRLERELMVRNTLYTTMAEAYEQVRVQEVRNTPVITVMEQPEVPARPVPRRLVSGVVTGLIVGSAIGMVAAFAMEYLRLRGVRFRRRWFGRRPHTVSEKQLV
jgi:uncharacterized protein involved in exopolysaccharide biosynthesis